MSGEQAVLLPIDRDAACGKGLRRGWTTEPCWSGWPPHRDGQALAALIDCSRADGPGDLPADPERACTMSTTRFNPRSWSWSGRAGLDPRSEPAGGLAARGRVPRRAANSQPVAEVGIGREDDLEALVDPALRSRAPGRAQ